MLRSLIQFIALLLGSTVVADAASASIGGAPVPLLGAGVPALVGLAAVARRFRKR